MQAEARALRRAAAERSGASRSKSWFSCSGPLVKSGSSEGIEKWRVAMPDEPPGRIFSNSDRERGLSEGRVPWFRDCQEACWENVWGGTAEAMERRYMKSADEGEDGAERQKACRRQGLHQGTSAITQ